MIHILKRLVYVHVLYYRKHSYDIIVSVIRLFLKDSYTIIVIPYYSFFQYRYIVLIS